MSSESLQILQDQTIGRVTLYWASDRREEAQCGGRYYFFEPRGECVITDRLDHEWNKEKTHKLIHRPPVLQKGDDAKTTAKFILEKYGDRGVVMLVGDGDDERRKQEARKTYIRWRVEHARGKQQQWLRKVEKATAGGGLPPMMNPDVREEIEFLERYEAGAVDRARYISTVDGYESNDRRTVEAWLKEKYPDHVRNQGLDNLITDLWKGLKRQAPPEPSAPAPRPEPEPPKPPPAAAAVVPTEDAALLLARASEFGVPVTFEETRALLEGDVTVGRDLAKRVENAIQAAQAGSQTRRVGRGKAVAGGRRATRRRGRRKAAA